MWKETTMKRILMIFGIILLVLILTQCSQTATTAPDTTQESPAFQADNGEHPGSTTPVTLAEDDALPGGGP